MFRNTIYNRLKHVNIFLSNVQGFKQQHFTSPTKTFEEKQLQKEIIQEYLGISYSQTTALIRNNETLKSVDNHKLIHTFKSLDKMGIDKPDILINPGTLLLHSNTVEHNILYLKEAGFTYASAQILLRFRITVKKPIALLKAYNIIPNDIDVPQRLSSFLNPKPSEFPILSQFTEEDTIVHVHDVIFKHYLVWRLQTTIEKVERVFKIYDRFKYKSFHLISNMINLLTETLKFPNEKVLQHGYLLQSNPVFVEETMAKFPQLAGIDIKTVLFKYPKIISVSCESISKIDKYLKDFGISDRAIQKCFDIYTLSPDSVSHRLNELKKVPQFKVYMKSERIVRLLLCLNKAKLRLDHLNKIKVNCVSIHVLCSSDSIFEKYAQEGNDRTKGCDIVNYLASELNLELKAIRQQLMVNTHWYHVSLITIQKTLQFLLENNIPKEEIRQNCVILLYSREVVQKAFMEIDKNPDTKNKHLTPRQHLNLCLYFIEETHHFSGNGVWQNTSTLNNDDIPEI